MSESFFNTIHLSGEELRKAVASAEAQEDAVYLIYKHGGNKYTAGDITRLTEKAGLKYPLWSNRRAITNLMNKGKLVKLNDKKIGSFGKPEHFYKAI